MHDIPLTQKEHPISMKKAQELIAGDLGNVYRDILKSCCIPIYWGHDNRSSFEILYNGTMTLLQTPERLLGATAAHVVRQYYKDLESQKVTLKLMNVSIDNLSVIDIKDELDLATIDINDDICAELKRTSGKAVIPLSTWPPKVSQEDRGIMLAGYRGTDIINLLNKSHSISVYLQR